MHDDCDSVSTTLDAMMEEYQAVEAIRVMKQDVEYLDLILCPEILDE